MAILFILNRAPYDSTDVTWNALRLAGALQAAGESIRIFLMNDAVDLGRAACTPPEGYDQDLGAMLRELTALDVPVKACGSCMARCGLYRNQPYVEGVQTASMPELATWVAQSEKVLTF
ncbi:MAG: DsrE/DsrF/TusD sulfur relay family protein [Halothiobacillaceae bacterium]